MSQYRLSFTSGRLYVTELALVAAELDSVAGDPVRARRRLETQRLLPGRTDASIARLTRELVDRTSRLSSAERDLLQHGNDEERAQLAWIALTRQYEFVADFARDIVREKFLALDLDLDADDFDRFLRRQAEWHPELEALAPSTVAKLRQNLMRMLREARIVNDDGVIESAMPSDRVVAVLSHATARRDLSVFPLHDDVIAGAARA
ncbi:BrxA family protein [Agromyces arachidis]|uniref:BrxA family protein n=1 Tax=Agromyces arachidis TaxID=766966 RepID=UPI004055CAF2